MDASGMSDNDYQDVHDALGILPTDPDQLMPQSGLLREMQSAPNKIASGVGDVLGINDALRAARGQMTPEEAKMFAITGAFGLIPGGRAESLLAKGGSGLARVLSESPEKYPALVRGAAALAKKGDVPEGIGNASLWDHILSTAQKDSGGTYAKSDPLSEPALKKIYENAWKSGEAPFNALSDHVEEHSDKGVYSHVSPDTVDSWKDELTAKHGEWDKLPEPEHEQYGHDEDQDERSGRDYAEHFEPLNWREHQTDPQALADLPPALREQGESLGFNFDAPLWKGGREEYPNKLLDPAQDKRYERGFFTTPSRGVAMAYGPTLPFVARAKNAMQVDWKKATGTGYYDDKMHDLIEAAREQGVDLLAVHNIKDIGSGGKPQSQYIALDPSILRAPHAGFNESRLHEAAPLAGVAGISTPIVLSGEAPSEESK
jgi:hypothetical protein